MRSEPRWPGSPALAPAALVYSVIFSRGKCSWSCSAYGEGTSQDLEAFDHTWKSLESLPGTVGTCEDNYSQKAAWVKLSTLEEVALPPS